MYSITFQQIEAFLAIARHANLSKAAETMFVSQPALSKILRRFENGAGLRAFTRSNQGIALTREGEYLYRTLEPLYNDIDKALGAARALSEASANLLRIIQPSSYDASEDFDALRKIVGEYEERYPDVITLESLYDFKDLRRALEYREADVAFTHDFSVSDLPGIAYRRISEFHMYVAISGRRPIVADGGFRFEKLGGETLYVVPNTGDRQEKDLMFDRCRELGFIPKRVEFAPNFQTLLHMIGQGRGFGICGRFNRAGRQDAVDIRYFPLPPTHRAYIGVAWYPERMSKQARDFIAMLPDRVP
ncbi:MAG: LysR family transcriptional regulator [Oscillospiraceae bacterium]|jgi:DNA-binding transcriptional LysR family regulator|nr:LysR family transcriptional regulator [Oscillospiraceae bacterium]